MTLPIVLRRAARTEFDAAGDWYERQRPGLGLIFTAAVQKIFDRIAGQSRLYRAILLGIRSVPAPGFPYCVYYRQRPSAIVVLAIFHTSRDPAVWKSRS
jgi:plasmid stabilization system protein ParE